MEKQYDAQKISRRLLDTVEQFNKYDRRSRTFGTDHELFIAEIHLIDFIGSNESYCISDIAKAIQVTKGAVSQTVKKLEEKGYLMKAVDSGNKARVIVRLTQKGQKAFEEHRRYHKELDGKVFDVVQNYDEQKRAVICEFLEEIQKKWE